MSQSLIRVLHVTPTLALKAGGPSIVVRRLQELASSCDCEASILTTGGPYPEIADVVALSSQWAALGIAGRRAIANSVAAADIIHLHTLWSPLVGVTAAEARRTGKPMVLSPHGMLDAWSLAQKTWRKSAYLELVERHTIAGAAMVHFTSSAERGSANSRLPIPNSCVIGLGADHPPVLPEALAADFRMEHPELADKLGVIFLGRLHAKKRPEAAIGAMVSISASIPNAVLLIVGDGKQSYVASLKELARRLGVEKNVHFMGHMEGRAKWRALAFAKMFLLPSQQENFAIAAAEALHAGVPVVLTPAVAIWPEVTEAGAGFLIDDSVDSNAIWHQLSSIAIRLLAEPAVRQRASKAARALAERAYTWEACANKTHTLYRQILHETTKGVGYN